MTLIASEPIGEDREIPALPLALGLAGLAPFILFGLMIALRHRMAFGFDAASGLLFHGATVLSFLGGSHWGLALRQPPGGARRALYLGAVAPPLWAFLALATGGAAGLFMLAVGLATHGAVDAVAAGRFAAPRWYPRLRLLMAILSTIAVTAAGAVIASQQGWVS